MAAGATTPLDKKLMLRRLIPLAATLVLLAACGTDSTRPDGKARKAPSVDANALTSCALSYNDLVALANTVFGPGSPNVQSVLGKLSNLKQQIENGNTATAKAKAHDIASFVLAKEKEKDLIGTPAQVAAFVSGVYCFAGVDLTITDPSNTSLIFPTDPEQVVYNSDRTVGIKFPNFPVTAPTLVVIEKLLSSALITKLDQYPGFVDLKTFADGVDDPFVGVPGFEAIVGVCADAPAFLFDLDRLRLGHQEGPDGTDFVITPRKVPAAEGIQLSCDEAALRLSPSAPRSSAKKSTSAPASVELDLIPDGEELQLRSGGVGGTVREFSPFAPVDEELTLRSGGVGGTVREFIRSPLLGNSVTASETDNACSVFTAPIGSLVSCRPTVDVMTFKRLLSLASGGPIQGNVFHNVPVTWTVMSGAGLVAPNTAAGGCTGTPGSTAATFTGPAGRASACWTLGLTPGTNTLRAQVNVGGEVPAGVTFDDSGIETFTATATPPSQLAFVVSPSLTQTAGVPFLAVVEVRDANGERVYGYNGQVTITLNQNTFASGSNIATVTATQGAAQFSLAINKAATGYQLAASASHNATALTGATSASFNVVAAAAASMAIVSGNNQTAASGTVLPVNPTVIVRDAFANVVSGVAVDWTATLSSGSTVSPNASVTGAAGTTSTAWTVGDGVNELRAGVTGSNPEIAVYFTATGTNTLSVLNSCPVGGSGDPINDPTKPYAFYMTHKGGPKTLKTVQLFFSATGKANVPSTYNIELVTVRGTFNPLAAGAAPDTTVVPVVLRGSANESRPATFALRTPVPVSNNANVMVMLRVLNNPDNATVRFNSGPCSPGTSCKPPAGCDVTEVSSPFPYALGTFYRKSVGLIVKGN